MKKKMNPSEIKQLLEEKGIRPTVHRIKIAEFLCCNADHPDAEEVRGWAEKHLPTVSKGTVYNTLNELVNAKLISEFKFPHSSRTIYDCKTQPHYHLLDVDSGSLIDIDPSQVSIDTDLAKEYEIDEISILFKGKKKS